MVFLVLHATAITDQLPLLLVQGGVKDGWLDLSHAGSQTNSDVNKLRWWIACSS